MGRRTTNEDLEFIKKNWLSLSNVEIAISLGINKVTVSQKGKKLGLPNKQNIFAGKYKRTHISPDIVNYGPGPESIIEATGREKTLQLENIKQQMKDKANLKFKVKTGGSTVPDRILKGTILQKNDNFVAVKLDKYIECFRYTDFLTGNAVIM